MNTTQDEFSEQGKTLDKGILVSRTRTFHGQQAPSFGRDWRALLRLIFTMARQAVIMDLQTGTIIRLGQSRIAMVLGLSRNNDLHCSTGELGNSEIITELCRIKHKADGHWLIPSSYLMTSVNDDVIKGHILLKHGSVIKVNSRYMRYSLSSMDYRASSQSLNIILSRDAVTNLADVSNSTLRHLTGSTTFDPATVYASMKSLSNNISGDQDALSLDPELLQFLQTNNGLAHMTAAIVSQHMFTYTALKLSAEEIDGLFLSFEHVTSCEEVCFSIFLCEYEQLFDSDQGDRQENAPRMLDLAGSACIHSPVIHLLTSLLKLSLDPIQYSVLWLRMLAVLSKPSKSHTPMIEYNTASAVLGCMAAKPGETLIQEHGCYVLSRIAKYKVPCGRKRPFREGAVQIVLDAIKSHMSIVKVTRNAIRFLGNLTQTYARLAMDVGNMSETSTLEEQRDTLLEIMRMLNFIEEAAVPLLKDILDKHIKDQHCQSQIRKIMSYFQDNINESTNGDVNDSDVSKAEHEEDIHVEDHFNQTHDLSEAIACVSSHSITKKATDFEKQNQLVTHQEQNNDCSELSKQIVKTVGGKKSQQEDLDKARSTDVQASCSHASTNYDVTPVKNKPGMLAFAVKTSKKEKEAFTSRKEEIKQSLNGAVSIHSSGSLVINGVEFFSDDDDSSPSRNTIQDTVEKTEIKRSHEKLADNSTESPETLKQPDFGDHSDAQVSDQAPGGRSPESTVVAMQPFKGRTFVSEAALVEGKSTAWNRKASYSQKTPQKKLTFFGRLTKKNSKPKKRFSILSTEYTQKPKVEENVKLNSSRLLFDFKVKQYSDLMNAADMNKIFTGPITNAETHHSTPEAATSQPEMAADQDCATTAINSIRNKGSLDIGDNVFRYVNIFCSISKTKVYKDTVSIASSTDSTERKKVKAGVSSQSVVEFVRRTRRLFLEGRGRYDITEAAIQASFRNKNISGLSYIPLSLEEHGYDCNPKNSLNLQQEVT